MIWDFQDILSRRLILWSALSIVAGALLVAFAASSWLRGFGVQALAWGVIDAAIALSGQLSARRRRASSVRRPATFEREARNLRRLLWINTWLDVLYLAGGLVLVYTLGAQDAFAAGSGWGVIVQGGFLFIFDLLHAVAVPRREPKLPALDLFAGLEHAAFRLSGSGGLGGGEGLGDSGPAAVLVHGFGGTPAEMRGIAEVLHQRGWTVDAPLLPGFGSDIATLTERRYAEWLAAVEGTGRDLVKAGHQPLLLVGYSLGAALALVAAQMIRPSGLIVLAPFWWPEKGWTRFAEFFARPFLPIGFRPLRKADFADPNLRQGIAKFMPGLDLDDPATQAALRDFRVPLGLIDQLRRLSRRMLDVAPQTAAPVLVVQGARDSVVPTAQTRRLLSRFANPPTYIEVDAEHDLALLANPAWPQVEAAVLAFAERIEAGEAARTSADERG